MALSSRQRDEIEQALLAAFPTEAELTRMLLHGLNEHLTHIVKPAALRQMVFELVQWAEQAGQLPDLIRGAVAENPTNPAVQALLAQIEEIPAQPMSSAWVVPFMAPSPPAGFVQRPAEFVQLKRYLLTREQTDTVGISAALRGAGGYGKTTLAQALCADAEVRVAFPDGILWVELGQQPGNLAGRVQDWIYMLIGQRPGFAGLDAAQSYLRGLLERRSCLLVVDDVWDKTHARPFLVGGPGCAALLTTRNRATLPPGSQAVDLDAMQGSEAVQLLGAGLPSGEERALQALAARLGEWPLLLTLVNGALRMQVEQMHKALSTALGFVTRLLDKRGLTAFDPDNATERNAAVATTLRASLDLLTPEYAACFGEVAIFPEDTDIPLSTLTCLWSATGGYDITDTEYLCQRLNLLSLLDYAGDTIRLHDVVRAYLLEQPQPLSTLHGRLVDAWGDPHALPDSYAWTHLAYHLMGAGRVADLRQLLLDYAWVEAKLTAVGIAALLADYDLLPSPDAAVYHVHEALRLSAHVLAEEARYLPSQLWGRLDPSVAPVIETLLEQAQSITAGPWLRPLRPSLLSPDPFLSTWKAHSGVVTAVLILRDGQGAVSAASDHTLRLWDLTSGQPLRTFCGHTGPVYALAELLDAERILSAAADHTMKLWDRSSGQELVTFRGHSGVVTAVALLPDGHQAISTSSDTTLRLWDLDTGQQLQILAGHQDIVTAVAVLPDGRWAVSASADHTLKLWDLTRAEEVRTMTGHTSVVTAVTVLPDSHHAVSSSSDNTLKVWDLDSGQERYTLRGHVAMVHTVAVFRTADGGSQAVSASSDGTCKLWDLENGRDPRQFASHARIVTAIAVRPQDQLAVSTSSDHRLCLWDLASGQQLTSFVGDQALTTCGISPDGSTLITGEASGRVHVLRLERPRLVQPRCG